MPKTSQPTKQNRLKVLYVALPPIIVQWNHSVKKGELGSITGQDFIPYMGVSRNRGTPKSSILIGFPIINHPFWGTPIFGKTHIP